MTILISTIIGFTFGWFVPFHKDDREYTVPLFSAIGLLVGAFIKYC